jgi:L-threonylcarbamoyladenylate synthase
VLQTSANLTGGPDPRSLSDIPTELHERVDIVLDGGALSGTPSSVLDLTRYERDGSWELLREAALAHEQVAELLNI